MGASLDMERIAKELGAERRGKVSSWSQRFPCCCRSRRPKRARDALDVVRALPVARSSARR